MHRILLIDDDMDILQLNQKFLEQDGYQIQTACSSQSALKVFTTFQPDCIVLDIMMPDTDGFILCKHFRAITDIPIIFLSGKGSEEDKVDGFLCGADDYVTKPYSLKELSVRIQSHIKRYCNTKINNFNSTLDYPPLLLDLLQHKAYHNDSEILLSNREYELLYVLVSNVNTPITFQEIGCKIWGVYSDADRRSIMVIASRLRKKLDNYPQLQNTIETIWSKGYCFRYKKQNTKK